MSKKWFIAMMIIPALLAMMGCGDSGGGGNGDDERNEAPVISSIPDQDLLIGEALSIDLRLYITDDQSGLEDLSVTVDSQTNTDAVAVFVEDDFLRSGPGATNGTSLISFSVSDPDGLSQTSSFLVSVAPAPVACNIHGVNFSPYMDGQSPNFGTVLEAPQIRNRLEIIAPYTNWVKTFGFDGGLELIPDIAHEYGIGIAAGAWLSRDLGSNEIQLSNLMAAAKTGSIDIAIIGSEVLQRGDLTAEQLIAYIDRFKDEVPDVPVTTSDTWPALLNHPEVMAACDVVFANFYPYWEGVNIDSAVATLYDDYLAVEAAAGEKQVIVGETGWPSAGNQIGQAVPSAANAAAFFLDFVSLMREKGLDYFYFEAFDETWKITAANPQEGYWGIWDKDGVLKEGMQPVFDCETTAGR